MKLFEKARVSIISQIKSSETAVVHQLSHVTHSLSKINDRLGLVTNDQLNTRKMVLEKIESLEMGAQQDIYDIRQELLKLNSAIKEIDHTKNDKALREIKDYLYEISNKLDKPVNERVAEVLKDLVEENAKNKKS